MKKIIAIVLSLFVITSCTKTSTKLEFGLDKKDTMQVNFITEPPTLDWQLVSDTTSAMVVDNLMEGLVELDYSKEPLEWFPNLAESLTPQKNASVWVIKLRKGIKWTDGEEFVAKHVKDAWVRLLNPKTATKYAYYLYSIKNAKEFNEGKIKNPDSVGIKIVNDYELVVTLTQPKSYFPTQLAHASTYPVRMDVVNKHGEDKWAQVGKIVTLGPYVLKQWKHDQLMHLERNENYFGEKAHIKNILGRMINEHTTAINLVDSGKLDFQKELPFSEIKHLSQRPDYVKSPYINTYYYGFNTKKPPFNDVRVRKAFSMAVDRDEVVKINGGIQVPIGGWIPPKLLGYKKDLGIKFNPKKAKELFKEAGYGAGGKKFPSVAMIFNTNENHKRVAENIQAQIKRNLGVQIELKNEEWKVYLKKLQGTDNYQMYRMGWVADYPDPDDFMTLMTSYSENNHTYWGNKEFDQIVKKASMLTDAKEREKLYLRAQEILIEENAVALPLYVAVDNYLIHSRVENFPTNIMQKYLFKQARLK